MLSAIREGVSFADPGERDVSLFCVVTELAKSFRGIKFETLQATLQQSIDRMVQDPSDTFGRDLSAKLIRANEYLLSADRAKVVPPTATRIEPRTVNELFQCLALEKGEDPLKHLILQHNRDMYLATSDKTYGLQYVYTSKEGILRQVSDKFDRFGVDLFKRSGEETRRLQPQELIDTYGTPIESVSYSFTSRQPMIRRKGAERNLLLPAAREPEPMPQFTQEIHDWLTILGGGSSLLLDWATLALDTSRPLAALVLLGTPGTGKSLFAQQLARYWTRDSPPTLDDALGGKGGFNEILLSCPLVFADEGQIPRDRREQPRSREIRELVQKGKHTINAKHRAPSYLEGYPRIVIAANNDNVLDFGEALSADDIEAIRQRLRVVNVGQEAADFLKQQDIVGWVKDNLIAKHVAWYAEEMDVVHQGRFGIPPDDAGLLQFSFGLQGAVFEWLVKSVMHPNRVRLGTVVDQDRHVVRVRMVDIESYWTHFLERGKPTISSIARAVSPYVVKGSGTIEIPWHAILRWVERSNYCSADEIVNALLNYGSQRTLVAV
jgi:GTPase SAR1 family protein